MLITTGSQTSDQHVIGRWRQLLGGLALVTAPLACAETPESITLETYYELVGQTILGVPDATTLYVDVQSFLSPGGVVEGVVSEPRITDLLPTRAIMAGPQAVAACSAENPQDGTCPILTDPDGQLISLETLESHGRQVDVSLLRIVWAYGAPPLCVVDISYEFRRVGDTWETDGASYGVC